MGTDEQGRQEVGLFRYAVIRDAADPALSKAERGRIVRALAEREHLGPDGRLFRVARSTLDDWIRAYRTGGFQALVPRPPVVVARTPAQVLELENPLLGKECYIGSSTEPVVLKLTTGTTKPPPPNKPITGKPGEFTSRAEGRILVIKHNSLVDNVFAVPAAKGCGGKVFESLIDPIVNAKLGLPSPAGNNTAILNGTLEQTSAEAARESE